MRRTRRTGDPNGRRVLGAQKRGGTGSMRRGKSKASQPRVDGNSTTGTQALVEALSKRRWRAPQWVRDMARLTGWELRRRGRPKKQT
jgi:hypothetical protein